MSVRLCVCKMLLLLLLLHASRVLLLLLRWVLVQSWIGNLIAIFFSLSLLPWVFFFLPSFLLPFVLSRFVLFSAEHVLAMKKIIPLLPFSLRRRGKRKERVERKREWWFMNFNEQARARREIHFPCSTSVRFPPLRPEKRRCWEKTPEESPSLYQGKGSNKSR